MTKSCLRADAQKLRTIQHANETISGHNFDRWAIDEDTGTNLQALYSSSAVWKHKNRNQMQNFVYK